MRKKDIVVLDGKVHTVEEWCAIKKISEVALRIRLKKGMSMEQALTIPARGLGEPQPKQHRPDEYCEGCIYSEIVSMPGAGPWTACDYIGKTGRRRPCPPWDKCTVKKCWEEQDAVQKY